MPCYRGSVKEGTPATRGDLPDSEVDSQEVQREILVLGEAERGVDFMRAKGVVKVILMG